jgi:hypothetical protein
MSKDNDKDLWEESIEDCDTEFLKMSLKENHEIDSRAIRMGQRIKADKERARAKKLAEEKRKKSIGYRLGLVLDKLLDIGLKAIIPLCVTIGGLVSAWFTGLFENLLR